MSGGSVFWSQKGWDKLRERMVEVQDLVVKVGIQGDKAAERHPGGDLTNAEIAAVHEFSEPSDKPPGRPFIRPIYDDDPEKWKGELAKIASLAIFGKKAKGAMRRIGEKYRTAIINRMKAGIAPPLDEKTINRRRGQNTREKRAVLVGEWARRSATAASGEQPEGTALSETPLIDTGTLMGSISVVVEKK